MSHFAITPEQDAVNCNWYRDIAMSKNRRFRISISQYQNDDRTGQPGPWVRFTLFKMGTYGVRKVQQVCYLPTEAETIMKELDMIRAIILSAANEKHNELQLVYGKGAITDKQDEAKCHWFQDLAISNQRKARVSYIIYNTKEPVKSLYVQFKLFKVNEMQNFMQTSYVNITWEELGQFVKDVSPILYGLKNNAQ